MLPRCLTLYVGLLLFALAAIPSQACAQSSPAVLKIDGLGKGSAPLDGPWQFHLGDDAAWAAPGLNDATGQNGWEQIGADKTWGAQGHRSYAGYAWYRKHVSLSLAPGALADLALIIWRIDDVYEIYWNGQLVGHHGVMPPHPSYPYGAAPQTFGLGPVRDGVLAIRIWKAPFFSFEDGLAGGLVAAPVIGSPQAIASLKSESDYSWMRSRQYYFAMRSLYGMIALLSLLAWFRNRSQRVLLAIAAFCAAPVLDMFLEGLRLPISKTLGLGLLQPVFSMQDIALWFLLLYLLKLDENPRLYRITCLLAIIDITCTSLDGLLTFIDWSNPFVAGWAQWADGMLTAIFTLEEVFPLVLVDLGVRKRLDLASWLLAITAFLSEMILVTEIALRQGSRFTHWTLGEKLIAPLFTINGMGFPPQAIASALLLLAIVYAVYRYMQDTLHRHGELEQELKSARELQQVLIPEELPELPGFAITSAYKPAQEVGGDFFQIIPLEGEFTGSTLVLLGDVSGKGLRAAMTVSLIVGTVRTLAKFLPHPADVLAELNTRLCGRLQGGFTTCVAMRLDADGHCTVTSAGHPAPFLNKKEIALPGALPLGIVPGSRYQETAVELGEGDRLALYTDGLLEARKASGEIFSFERLDALFATAPSAAQATETAVDFGQDDDITVLTIARLATGERSSTRLVTPVFA